MRTVASERVTWTTRGGRVATVTIELVHLLETIGRNEWTGEPIVRDRGYDIRVRGEVEGMGVVGHGISDRLPPAAKAADPTAVGLCGKLLIGAEPMAEIRAAMARIESRPEYMADTARREGARAVAEEMDRREAEVYRAMGGGY